MICENKNCLHYDWKSETHCDSYDRFNKCGAKYYKGNRKITQEKMNEIIDNVSAEIKSLKSKHVCDHIKKELNEYFKEK